MLNKALFEKFRALGREETEGGGYTVIPIQEHRHKLGISGEGYPIFFVETSEMPSYTPNTSLEILSVEYDLACTFIDAEGDQTQNQYTVITLHSVERALQEDFFDIITIMFDKLPELPSKREIAVEVENIISIFTAMKCPPRKTIQGLWAELLVIERSLDPETLIKAWHDSPAAKYDFTMGRDKIEVKSTSSETRIHLFSLEQLCHTPHSRVVVASVIVRESNQCAEGLSAQDIYDKICDRVNSADVRMHLMKVMAETIRSDWKSIRDTHFDYVTACDTLRYYNSDDVPGVEKGSVEPGVTSVRFKSDLSGIKDIIAAESDFERGDSPLYNALY